jgi:hypothetical protein
VARRVNFLLFHLLKLSLSIRVAVTLLSQQPI